MSTIGDRIKEIRKIKGLTQQKFADELGLKRNTVGGYEIGTVSPSDRTIADISQKFDVNENWLRTGEGEMMKPMNRDAEIASFMGDVMHGESDDFRRRLVAVLAKLDASEWALLEKMAMKLAEESKKEDQA